MGLFQLLMASVGTLYQLQAVDRDLPVPLELKSSGQKNSRTEVVKAINIAAILKIWAAINQQHKGDGKLSSEFFSRGGEIVRFNSSSQVRCPQPAPEQAHDLLDHLHFENFHEWFKEQVNELDLTSNISNVIKALAQGPCYFARRFKAFFMNNGYRFRTKQCEVFMQTQNSGVLVVSMTESYVSTSDSASKSGNVTYYGRLNAIIELNYYEKFKVVLFKCDWVDCDTTDLTILKNIRDLEDDSNGWISDMHVNILSSNHLPLYVYSGILIQMVSLFKE
ncbi:hypothetical protein H5410_002559 [Solanum commersonii]|uniref:DUF4216 domain-containing protein n=1 Tax=Solanum commersonii TaxID=4109 RepID=A0A9J6B2M6_SOLCO|nr:hypothetical protein H5410_002559 [Solanum commersonii]